MTADEIRAHWKNADITTQHEALVHVTFYLAEIAAQLAELNNRMLPGNLEINTFDCSAERKQA